MKLSERILITSYTFLIIIFSIVVFLLPFTLFNENAINEVITKYLENPIYSIIPLILIILSIIILTLGINKKKVRLGIVHTNENGKLIISPKTFDSAAYYVIKNIKGIRDVNIETFIDVDGIEITVDAVVLTDINIPELTTEVQTTLKNYIETTTGIMVKLVHFHVKDISPQTQSMPRVR